MVAADAHAAFEAARGDVAELNRERAGLTLVGAAIKFKDAELLEKLIAAGADVDTPVKLHETSKHALEWLALPRCGSVAMVRLLVERGGASARSPTDLRVPLVRAAQMGMNDVARCLVAHGAALTDVNHRGQCFLEYADVNLADLMLAAVTADPSMLDRVNVSSFAWRLLSSSQPEAAALLELALTRGAKLPTDAADEACQSAHIDTIALLLRRGFKATLATMELAANRGSVPLVELLLAHGCPVDVERGDSPFLRAVSGGHVDVARLGLGLVRPPPASFRPHFKWVVCVEAPRHHLVKIGSI